MISMIHRLFLASEIDKAFGDVDVDQSDGDVVADIDSAKALY